MNEVEDIIDYFSPSAKKRPTITTTPRTRPTDVLNIHFSTPEVPDSALRKPSSRVPGSGSWNSPFDFNMDFSKVLKND